MGLVSQSPADSIQSIIVFQHCIALFTADAAIAIGATPMCPAALMGSISHCARIISRSLPTFQLSIWCTGSEEKLGSSQAEPDQAIKSAAE